MTYVYCIFLEKGSCPFKESEGNKISNTVTPIVDHDLINLSRKTNTSSTQGKNKSEQQQKTSYLHIIFKQQSSSSTKTFSLSKFPRKSKTTLTESSSAFSAKPSDFRMPRSSPGILRRKSPFGALTIILECRLILRSSRLSSM